MLQNTIYFYYKNPQETEQRRNNLSMIMSIYNKPTVNIILSSETLKASPLRPRRQGLLSLHIMMLENFGL